jgi:hypothetical protein
MPCPISSSVSPSVFYHLVCFLRRSVCAQSVINSIYDKLAQDFVKSSRTRARSKHVGVGIVLTARPAASIMTWQAVRLLQRVSRCITRGANVRKG